MSASPQMTREQWLEYRNHCITASSVAAIVGLHPWETPRTLYERMKGLSTPKESTEAMEMGIDLEPFIAAMFAKRNGLTLGVDLVPNGYDLLRHPENSRFAATPDYLLGDDELVECKWAGVNTASSFGREASDEAPSHYLLQCQWQLFVTGRKLCHLAVLTPFGFRSFKVKADAELQRRLAHFAAKFLGEYIDSDCPPPLTGHTPDTEWVKNKFPQDSGSVVRATDSIEEKIAELGHLTVQIKKLELEAEELLNQVKEFMGEASVLESDEGKFTYKSQSRSSIDSKKLRADYPDAAEACTTSVSFRVFRTPWKSEKA